MRSLFILIAFMTISCNLFSQASYKGKVIDAQSGEALTGASISIINSFKGVTTDVKGEYVLTDATSSDSISISMLGYNPLILPLTNNLVIRIHSNATKLNQVVVTAGREEQLRSEAPVAISTISKLVLNDTKPASIDQVLNKASGVYMVDLGNQQHAMAIRQPLGYKSLFLYLEDGIPIRTTGDFNHNALIEINMSSLKNIEIIRGPASSLYGSEAVGGAVNFITEAPTTILTGKIGAELSSQGCKKTDLLISNTIGKLGVYANGSFVHQHHSYRDHNNFSKLAFTLRGDYVFNSKTKLTTSATAVDYKTDQTGGLDSLHFYSKDYKSFHTFTYRKVKAIRFRSTLDHTWNKNNNSSFSAFFRNNSIAQNPFYAIKSTSNPLKARGEINEDAFNSYGIIAQHKIKFNFMESAILSGVSIDRSPVSYISHFIYIDKSNDGYYVGYNPTDSVLTDYNVDLLNVAGFIQGEISPLKKLKLTGAIRYDRLDYVFDNHLPPSAFTGAPDEKDYFMHFTPKAGFTYDLNKSRGVYANYSVGFAPPQISELYRGVKTPVLKPSTYLSYEAGGWLMFYDGKGYLELSVYQMDGVNEIVSVRLPDGSYENKNAGKTKHTGIEYTITMDIWKGINFRLNGSNASHVFVDYIEKGERFNGNKMNAAPNTIVNSEVSYKPMFLPGFRIALECQWLGEYFMDPGNTKTYEGFKVFNFRTGYRFNGFETWINVLNITDVNYATIAESSAWGSTYRPGNLRTVHVGVSYTFTGKNK